jgi:hemerythrin-like metal-binding protein
METIQWSDKYSVGVEDLDEQHRQIIGMLNRLVSLPETGDTRSETVSEILTTMTHYALEHFKTEERLLKEYDYPNFEEHRREHVDYRKKAIDFSMATSLGVEAVPQILLSYLMEWWTHHILEEDMKYKPFFAKKGVR